MAQSSNYKQYSRATRVLTEESNFSGGMLWTGNNIDETHLRAMVNCDYDDTTGYLKTRDPFATITVNAPDKTALGEAGINLKGYRLFGVYSICAFTEEEDLLDAGTLYLFTNTEDNTFNKANLKGVYAINADYILCEIDDNVEAVLRNVSKSNLLSNYENQLYGIGANSEGDWFFVYRLIYKDGNYHFTQLSRETIQQRIDSVTLLEACVSGFNAARKDTFTYGSESVATDDTQSILGVYIKDADDNIVVSPRAGQTVKLCVPVRHSSNEEVGYMSVFQLKENGDNTVTNSEDVWQLYNTAEPFQEVNFSDDETAVFEFDFTCTKKNNTLYFVCWGDLAPEDPITAYTEDAVDYYMYSITAGNNSDNLKLKSYNLNTCDGSCIWRNRMCLWGTQGNHNCLFLSEVDNFYYYPIPYNVAVFDTNVISCIPYKDTLLVFTADKIYRVSEANDGSFVQTDVQNDMPMHSSDSAHLTAIKNMVLFKSGNYFYMIVPKSQSLTDELSIAPIYKNVTGFLNDLDKGALEVLQLLYPEYLFNSCEVKSKTPTAVYSEQDTVHILYDVVIAVSLKNDENKLTTQTRFFKMFLNYNTNLRAWTLYFEDTTEASLEIASLTTDRLMSFVRVDKNGLFDIVTQRNTVTVASNFRILLDTGYRTLSTTTQKRFREVQLKLYSASEGVTEFGTAFLVDGNWRRSYSKLQEVFTEDNTISLVPTLDINTFITELSMPVTASGDIIKSPGSDAIELSGWNLDFSHFKREAPVTVRIPVSGKGYNPRFIFMVPNAAGVTVNEINWVYRLMHGR